MSLLCKIQLLLPSLILGPTKIVLAVMGRGMWSTSIIVPEEREIDSILATLELDTNIDDVMMPELPEVD